MKTIKTIALVAVLTASLSYGISKAVTAVAVPTVEPDRTAQREFADIENARKQQPRSDLFSRVNGAHYVEVDGTYNKTITTLR